MTVTQQLATQVMGALHDGAIMERYFPMLVRGGVSDFGVTVHSHFLTYLATVGHHLGFAAVAECPVPLSFEKVDLGDVRADSLWFDHCDLRPIAAFEFERFESGDEPKLRQKVENIAVASLATPSLELVVLVYWVLSGSTPHSMESVVAPYRDGFRRRGQQVPGGKAPLMIVKCVMRRAESNRLLFGEFLRDERNERLALGGL
jgi:hypothetical protein